ncbi:MAG: helix-turn-helix domain-containing protein [Candidatus Odinarchaeota archaeon]
MPEINQFIGEIIASRRKGLNISQEELAFRAGIHRTYMSQIERGIKCPTLKTLLAISEALESKLSDLIRELESRIR